MFAKIARCAIEGERRSAHEGACSTCLLIVWTPSRHTYFQKFGKVKKRAPSTLATSLKRLNYAAGALLGLLLAWTYADSMLGLWNRWYADPAYGHGFFVPLFASFFFGMAQVFSLQASRYLVGNPFDHCSTCDKNARELLVLPSCGGYIDCTDNGRHWSLTIRLVGLVMVWPIDGISYFHGAVAGRICELDVAATPGVATIASTYLVQLIGIPAVAEGNVIVLTNAKIGVIEACNGLRMLILFIAVATAVAILINRPWWCRCIVLASAVPVALVVNILRITSTAVAYEHVSSDWAGWWFHGLAAWLMMPLGILFLCLELVYLDRAFPAKQSARPLSAV